MPVKEDYILHPTVDGIKVQVSKKAWLPGVFTSEHFAHRAAKIYINQKHIAAKKRRKKEN